MRTPRVFIAQPLATGAVVTLPKQASEHVTRVLRLTAGAALKAFDGSDTEFDAELIATGKSGAQLRIGAAHSALRESPVKVVLLQSLARGEKMDWIVQKATELGASRIVAVLAERSVVRLDAVQRAKRRDHWRAIAIAACEQSGRNRLPGIDEPLELDAALALTSTLEQRLVFDALAQTRLTEALDAAATANSIGLLVGPEGGLTGQELELASRAGFHAVRFGPRIMRTETAAVAALAVVQNRLGDL